jgi:prevent-host-death family protein
MAEVIHISDLDAAKDFADLLARVRQGAEVVIERDGKPVAVVRGADLSHLSLAERLKLIPEDSPAVMDEDFARDVEAAIESHREPLEPPAWD